MREVQLREMPKDFLLINDNPAGILLTLGWEEKLGEPEECRVRMDKWWREAAAGKTPLYSYYQLLEGCEWAVWRVRSPQLEEQHLRVMKKTGGGDDRVSLAVHLQLCSNDFNV